jgi:hypothetical protein
VARQRMTNIALYEEIRLLLARMDGKVDSVLQLVGGMSYMKASEIRAQTVPRPDLGAFGPTPPLGRALTEEEKAENLRKAKEASDHLKKQFELGIESVLSKRAGQGIPNDGNAVTEEDLKVLDEMSM